MSEHGRTLDARFRSYPLTKPSAPWKLTLNTGIGGLYQVGFGPGTEYLLVVSAAGRGVFDCRTGERLARSYEVDKDIWIDSLCVKGIGPLAGMEIRTAGINGGGLLRITDDGWTLKALHFDWQHDIAILCPPKAHIFDEKTFEQCRKIFDGDPLCAYGFSDTGKSMVIAEGGGVSMSVFHRAS
ncbi:MAG: hypothetical protein ACLQVD_14760 [Capsulimonadaceae bacterium]